MTMVIVHNILTDHKTNYFKKKCEKFIILHSNLNCIFLSSIQRMSEQLKL